MKQKMRDHIRTCGQVTGFLSHYHILSKGESGKSALALKRENLPRVAEHWDKLSWTKPLLIWLLSSMSCK
jgi:hypothetical protein